MRATSHIFSAAFVVVLSAVMAICVSEAQAGKVRLVVTETSITKGPVKGLHRNSRGDVSLDYTKVAYNMTQDKRWQVGLNGKPGKIYTGLGKIAFTADNRLVYPAGIGKNPRKETYVIDGVEAKVYEEIWGQCTLFSPDGKHIIYVVKAGPGYSWRFIYDGVEQKVHDELYAPVFSPDSKRWAYIARVGWKFLQVIDGVEQKIYPGVANACLVFSPDSKRWAYKAFVGPPESKTDKARFVIDGVEGKTYRDIAPIAFSPDSKHYAYMVKIGEKCTYVLDGKEMTPHWDKLSNGAMFTSDNKVVFVAFDKEKGSKIVIDGVEGKGWYDFYMKNSLRVSNRGGRTAFISGRKDRFCWVVDDKPGRLYTQLKAPPDITFSPDGKRFAYAARRGRRWVMVVDEREIAEGAFVRKPVFSPDSKHLAYYIKRPCGHCIGRNNVVGKGHPNIHLSTITFSPDSKHLLYMAYRKKDKKRVIVVDGVETEQAYDGKFRDSVFHFTGPDSFRAVMLRDEELFWVDVKIIEDSTRAAENRKPGK